MNRDAFLNSISCRSIGLEEHILNDDLVFREDKAALDVGRARAQRWLSILGRFDEEGAKRRFTQLGFAGDLEDLALRFRPVQSWGSSAYPDWTIECWTLIDDLCRLELKEGHDEVESIAFGALFEPLAQHESRSLFEHAGVSKSFFSAASINDLSNAFCQQLSNILSKCLQHEFSIYRLNQVKEQHGEASENSISKNSSVLLKEFLDALKDGAIYDLMIKYSNAAREAVFFVRHWRTNMCEMLSRFNADKGDLESFLSVSPDTLFVEHFQVNLGDPHNEGRSVAKLTFREGLSVYYKPRDTEVEERLKILSAPLTAGMKSNAILFPDYLVRDGYGWAREVQSTVPDLKEFYFNGGHTLACAWAFGGTDLHDENIVMSSGPVIVDGEMFASPIPALKEGSPIQTMNMVELDTVLRSGMLPRWETYGDGSYVLINGLAGGRVHATGMLHQRFEDVNTDGMRLVVEETNIQAPNILPQAIHSPSDYTDYLVAGFEHCCDTLETMIEERGVKDIADSLADISVRFLVRDTNIYAILQQRLRLPQFALSALDSEIEIDVLGLTFLSSDAAMELWSIFLHEKKSLISGDIPFFKVKADQYSWFKDGLEVKGLFQKSGVDVVVERLKEISQESTQAQAALIRASMYAVEKGRELKQQASVEDHQQNSFPDVVSASRNVPIHWEDAVHRIAERICESAVHMGSAVNWIAPVYNKGEKHFKIKSLDCGLYDGQSGVALFLASHYKVLGDRKSGILARQVFDTLSRPEHLRPWSAELDVVRGGCVGRASLAFALNEAATLLNEPAYRDAALHLIADITQESVTQNSEIDWISGVAGEAAAVLHVTNGDNHNYCRWATARLKSILSNIEVPGRTTSCDFSGAGHGLAGIALALLRISKVYEPAKTLLDSVVRDLRGAFWDSLSASWHVSLSQQRPDLGNYTDDMSGWAHGDAGVITMLGGFDIPELVQAHNNLKHSELLDYDTLSMGNGSLIEMWLQSGDSDMAQSIAGSMVARAGELGRFRTPGSEFLSPGLFNGLAGIGYSILRCRYPESLANVLRLEGGGNAKI